ncbi:MAG: AraC family transcriptional regulator [Shimia sp.]|jgi:AraC-like DNA-binding protein|uniref:AraC family transcriptional regulator n=1 Tax=Shimia sp. TaxID=1954381 RepID=UPI0025F834B2|nr:AraC family transcriptional regulator [Shimia sp.]MCH2066220.1 AraC family transcriptional regulator [Shimia sp.]
MMQSTPKHATAMGRHFSEYLMSLGFSEAEIFRGTGLTRADLKEGDHLISLEGQMKILDNGEKLTGDDLVAVRWGQTRRFANLGLIGYLGRTSKDIRCVVTNLARYGQVFSNAMEVDVSTLDQDGTFRWRFDIPAKIEVGHFVEAQVSQFLNGTNKLLPRTVLPKQITFTHRRKHNAAELEKLLGCPVTFGAQWNSMQYRLADLDVPLSTSDEGLHKILQAHADLVLAQRPKNRADIELVVEKAIADRMATGQTSVSHVARDLGMSARTLARRLGDANTTYQTVLSNFRRAMADRYLKNSEMSQSEIAFLLGYSDVSSFASAFKRWTGQSPGERRQSLA